VFHVAERYNLTPRLATINPEALDAFVDAWVEGKQHVDETRTRSALLEEFDIERLAARFQAAFA